MVPASVGSRPARHSNSVVLPAPFGPIRPRISPSRTSKPTPSSTVLAPYRFVIPRASSSMLLRFDLKPLDPASSADGPTGAAARNAHGIVRTLVKQLPRLAAIGGDVRPGCPGRDPELERGDPRDRGAEAMRPAGRNRPGSPAIGRDRDILAVLFVFGVIAADNHPETGIRERDREDAGAGAIVADRNRRHAPGAAAIPGMEDPTCPSAAGNVPDLVRPADKQ